MNPHYPKFCRLPFPGTEYRKIEEGNRHPGWPARNVPTVSICNR